MKNESGTVLYQCSSCESFSDVKIDLHVDESTYMECNCGELCKPVSSPADLICDLQNRELKLKEFITKTAEPALILAAYDYPVSHGPAGNLAELKRLKKNLIF
ncbi:hypothetical protein [Moritella viscosa]|uniref:Uncharacterized protein n=1 Tax=Moritella viscosa TaxID=80854 RepID=A0A1L0B6L4_9GAMM|nr:hypothetical protein [Moritella viscosa]SGY92289.1 Putative uncharacterized protein [Moritella viscosa]